MDVNQVKPETKKSKAAEEPKQAATVKNDPSPEEFVTTWALYTPANIREFSPPNRVAHHCDKCGKETTWIRMGEVVYSDAHNVPGGGFYWASYSCALCSGSSLVIMYKILSTQGQKISTPYGVPASPVNVVRAVQKIGQYPALSITVPRQLQKTLGETATALYKRGLINRNEGYGLGAVTYIRRVVEDKTDELLDVAAELAESYNVETEVVDAIRKAKTQRISYEQKLKIAATVLPDVLLVDGVNPLGKLYEIVSKGIHELSEEDCIAVADETAGVFEFIFSNLRAMTKARHDFVDRVRTWAKRQSSQQPTAEDEPGAKGKNDNE